MFQLDNIEMCPNMFKFLYLPRISSTKHGILYPELSFRSGIFVKFRNSKKNVLKIVLIIVNINQDEINHSFQINSLLKTISPPLLGELFCGGKN